MRVNRSCPAARKEMLAIARSLMSRPKLLMPKVWRYYSDIVDSIDNINSKEIFASLFWSFENYIKRLNMWFCQIFTWEVMGGLRCSKTVADYERLLDLTLRTEPYMKNAAETRI